MRRAHGLLAAVATAALMSCAGVAEAQVETSLRASVWSSERTAVPDGGVIADVEAWARGRWKLGEAVSLKVEGWAASDPVGDDAAALDVREAYVAWQPDRVRLTAGRQVFAWGRADRLNPTDVLGARDQRRLVDDEGDNRLGVGALSAQFEIARGQLNLIWAPEFRGSRLPQDFGASGIAVRQEAPPWDAGQFALRYERFGQALDWSVTYAEVVDRTPWVSRTPANEPQGLILFHPRLRMLGADAATTLGPFGLRAEAAAYAYDDSDLRGAAIRKPRFALALGMDREFPGQININVQALVRTAETLAPPPGLQLQAARANGAIQYAWRDTVVGGLVRVRKTFADDRASLEATLGGFSGGGRYEQVRLNYALRDGVRLTAMAEQFSGLPQTLLGRQQDNSLFTLGVRFGY